MSPLDIVKVLTAAAPIAASVASMANNKSETIERKEPSITNNISVTINNNFYTSSEKDAKLLASQMQNDLISTISSGTRYML